jgi:hypothetical protein
MPKQALSLGRKISGSNCRNKRGDHGFDDGNGAGQQTLLTVTEEGAAFGLIAATS